MKTNRNNQTVLTGCWKISFHRIRFILCFTILLLASLPLQAQFCFTEGQFTYSTDGNTAEVSNVNNASAEMEIPATVMYCGQPIPVIGIEGNVFQNCDVLTKITLPESIQTIGNYAFYECKNLTSIVLPKNMTYIGWHAFMYCSKLQSIEFPQHLKTIGGYAFGSCESLTSVIFPEELTNIEDHAFQNCTNLTSITFPDGLSTIEISAFYGCCNLTSIVLPKGLTTIESGAFQKCTKLAKVIFNNDGMLNVDSDAFAGDDALQEVYAPDIATWCRISFGNDKANPTTISRKLYINGTRLTKTLTIPEGITKINDYAFYGLKGILTLTIPNNVKEIGMYAFYNCEDLSTINFGEKSVETIGAAAFGNCVCLNSVSLPQSLIHLSGLPYIPGTFQGCTNLEKVSFNDNLKTIGEDCFAHCSKLTSIIIPNSVVEIEAEAFYGCSLTEVSLGESVEKIGDWAFHSSTENVSSITIPKSLKEANGIGFQHLKNTYISDLSAWCRINWTGIRCNWGKLYLNGELIENLVIPEDITELKQDAFAYCAQLKSVKIHNHLSKIGYFAFGECTGLKAVYCPDLTTWLNMTHDDNPLIFAHDLYIDNEKVDFLVLPNGINEIKSNAFKGCSLKYLYIPESVEFIKSDAFKDCANLTYIYSNAVPAPTLNSELGKNSLKGIYVFNDFVQNYKNKWSNFSDIIFGVNDVPSYTEQFTDESLFAMKAAYKALANTEMTYVDLTESTLDESVTSETLKTGDTNSNTVYFLPSGTTSVTGDNIVVDGQAANIVLEDCQPFGAPTEFTASSAFYSRTQGVAGKWATICLPFSCDIPNGITIEEFERFNGNSVIFKPVTSIEAGKPYLFKADDGVSEVIAQAENVTVLPVSEVEGKTAEFIGVLSQTITFDSDFRESGCTYYGINADANEFQRLGEKATCQPFRAYLKVKDTLSAKHSAYKVIHGGDDGTTGIIDAADGTDGSKTIYNVNGQRLNALQKGMNIINGKKVIIK